MDFSVDAVNFADGYYCPTLRARQVLNIAVVMVTPSGMKTINQIAQEQDVHPMQARQWKRDI